MKREDRYIVIKRSDLEAAQAAGHVGHIEVAALNYVGSSADRMRLERNKMPLKCVVVESDWPEYELVWELIRLRVEKAEIPAETVQGIVDAPAVDAALRAFTDDATNDNAFFLVRAIMEACLPRAPETFDSVEEGLAATKHGETFNVSKVEFGPAWDGEGLPPVGATIEFTNRKFRDRHDRRVWLKATVKYVSPTHFVYTDDEGVEHAIDVEIIKYRPVMTPEERYEHRKEKAVKAMIDIYKAPASVGLSIKERMEIIFAAIAAGDVAGVTAIKDYE